MTAQDGGVLPAGNGQATNPTVADTTDIELARRIAQYRARQQLVARIALDRHIAHCYGPEYVRGWAA